MNKFTLVILILLLTVSFYAEDRIISEIDKYDILVGEQISMKVRVSDFEPEEIVKEEVFANKNGIEIVSITGKQSELDYEVVIVFTSFTDSFYKNLYFTIPVIDDEEIFYIESSEFSIKCSSSLSEQQSETIKNIDDPSKIELKAMKDQYRFRFNYFIILLIVFGVIFALLISFIIVFFVSRMLNKRKSKDSITESMTPYERFRYRMERIVFDTDDRHQIESLISEMTESFKELLDGLYENNFSSETTREFIIELNSVQLPYDMISDIKLIFDNCDLIKFAKASHNRDQLKDYHNKLIHMGSILHNFIAEINKGAESND